MSPKKNNMHASTLSLWPDHHSYHHEQHVGDSSHPPRQLPASIRLRTLWFHAQLDFPVTWEAAREDRMCVSARRSWWTLIKLFTTYISSWSFKEKKNHNPVDCKDFRFQCNKKSRGWHSAWPGLINTIAKVCPQKHLSWLCWPLQCLCWCLLVCVYKWSVAAC